MLWDPFTAVDFSRIGRVQRRFLYSASFILNIDHNQHDYYPVIFNLGLVPLVDRKVEANLLLLNKPIYERIDVPTLLSQINVKIPSRHTRSSAPFIISVHNTIYGTKLRTIPD